MVDRRTVLPFGNSPRTRMPSGILFILIFAMFALPARTLAADPVVTVTVPSLSGEPGEVVAIEFRATLLEPAVIFTMRFDLPRTIVEFLATDVSGTASAHVPDRSLIFNPNHRFGEYEGFLLGVRLKSTNEYIPLGPGEDLLIAKALVRIQASAPVGEYPINLETAVFTSVEGRTLKSTVADVGTLRVDPPDGPRPVGNLESSQAGADVTLSWDLTESYDAIKVLWGNTLLDSLGGSETTFLHRPDPGPITYRVIGVKDEKESIPVSCEFMVMVPRPPAVKDFTCSSGDGTVSLGWTNAGSYNSITVLRNGRVIAELEGTAQSYEDSFSSDLFTVYTVQGREDGLDSWPANCFLNEASDTYLFWAEEVEASPGDEEVPVRVFGTHEEMAQAYSLGVRIDPALAVLRALSLEETLGESFFTSFLYQRHLLDQGETAVGVGFPYETQLPPGGDQHLLTVLVDIPAETPAGAIVPVELGNFGDPPASIVFSIRNSAVSKKAEVRSGLILVGESPIPQVTDAAAEVVDETPPPSGGGGEAPPSGSSILIRWTNPEEYSSIRIERDGVQIAEIPGDRTDYRDAEAGPGVHRYRIVAAREGQESFPQVVVALPVGVPGTFIRGDVNSDRSRNITDVINLLTHLFLGGFQPACLDASDTDDSGELDLSDAITLLRRLYLGSRQLPPPTPNAPWFDPTDDDLPCG